jgi:hypothetical protein
MTRQYQIEKHGSRVGPASLSVYILAVTALLIYLGLSALTDTSRAFADPSAAPLLHRSMTIMQHAIHGVHGDAVVKTRSCCPTRPALLRLTGDCVTRTNTYAVRAAAHGTMSFDGKSIVAINFHDILIASHSPPSIRMWTRSRATHNTWRIATRQAIPTHDMDLMVYLCPTALTAQFTQHFPTHLVNLGPVTIRGESAWHFQDRIAVTRGGMKGTVLQSDFYLARPSLYWLEYGSLFSDGTVKQLVSASYSRLNVPVTITAPSIGSSVP